MLLWRFSRRGMCIADGVASNGQRHSRGGDISATAHMGGGGDSAMVTCEEDEHYSRNEREQRRVPPARAVPCDPEDGHPYPGQPGRAPSSRRYITFATRG